jgi:hypothetical protein
MRKIVDETIGWYGTFVTVLAYALLSFGFMSSSTFSYQILNLLGALGILYICVKRKIWQSATVNIVWAIIAMARMLIR